MQPLDEQSKTRLARAQDDACPSSTLWHAYCMHANPTGIGDDNDENTQAGDGGNARAWFSREKYSTIT